MGTGIILGGVVDNQGTSESGIQIGSVRMGGSFDSVFQNAIYPDADDTDASTESAGGSTSANGVFVVPGAMLTNIGGTTDGSSLATSVRPGTTGEPLVFTAALTATKN